MSTGGHLAILVSVFIALMGLVKLGYILGDEYGRRTACESVKLEWVQDKCMKVTREAV